jgi:hypothetical protein
MDASGSGQRPVAGYCEDGNELSGSLKKVGNFLTRWVITGFSRRITLHGISHLNSSLHYFYNAKHYHHHYLLSQVSFSQVLLLNQWRTPPLWLQVSYCNTFLILCCFCTELLLLLLFVYMDTPPSYFYSVLPSIAVTFTHHRYVVHSTLHRTAPALFWYLNIDPTTAWNTLRWSRIFFVNPQ